MTEIDGVEIHFIHVRSRHEDALPLIMTPWLAGLGHRAAGDRRPADRPDRSRRHPRTHSTWSAVVAWLRLLGRAGELGWESGRIARRVGGADAPPRLHPLCRPGRRRRRLRHGRDGPPSTRGAGGHPRQPARRGAGLEDQLPAESEQECAAHAALDTVTTDGSAYFLEQSTRPQTIGYSVLDSPVALAAWLLDHDTDSYYKISRAFVDGEPVGNLTRDNIVDNITLYWLTGTGASAARWYWETGRFLAAARRPARLLRRSRFRSASRRFPARSGLPRAAGSRRSTPASPTSTRSTRAATSPPGSSRSCSPPSSASSIQGASLDERLRTRAHALARRGDGWLNSEPLGHAELRGHVVLVNFWTPCAGPL